MDYLDRLLASWPVPYKILFFLGVAIVTHLLVLGVRFAANLVLHGGRLRNQKARSVTTLATSVFIFTLYFLATGLVLREIGVSLTAYLASASVIGLAIGFGSQGIVQDAVMGLTFIFSDIIDVGDLVDIGGQTGKVRSITMRFIELENALGARVFIPNRTINNVVNFPKGYIRCLADVTLLGSEEEKDQMARTANALMQSAFEQFPGILLTAPSIEGRMKIAADKEFVRIKFRMWPNRGQPIETTFVKELGAKLRLIHADYQDWMIAVYYEVEEKPTPSRRRL